MSKAPKPLPRLIWRDGIHLASTLLWFDAPRRHHLSFVSHAHVPVGKAGKVLLTSATAALLGIPVRDALLCEYGRTLTLGPLHIELFPSGHMLGAAQASVYCGESRVVYAGDLHPEGSPTAAPAEVRHCDVLVLECPFGLPRYRFPPRAEAAEQVIRSVEQALADGAQPVVLASSPGKAQDLMLSLAAFPLVAHRDIARHARAYHKLGVRLPRIRDLRGRLRAGEVLLWPPEARGSRLLGALERPRYLYVSGYALDAAVVAQMRCDLAIPMSDSADWNALMGYVEAARPRRVYLTAGFAQEMAAELRRRGCDAAVLGRPHQMKLFG